VSYFKRYADAVNSGDYCTCKDVRMGDTRVEGTKIVHRKIVERAVGDEYVRDRIGCGKPIITPVNMNEYE
jgi:hypothetical protein